MFAHFFASLLIENSAKQQRQIRKICAASSISVAYKIALDLDQVRLTLGLLAQNIRLGDDDLVAIEANSPRFFQGTSRAADRFRRRGQVVGNEGAGDSRLCAPGVCSLTS